MAPSRAARCAAPRSASDHARGCRCSAQRRRRHSAFRPSAVPQPNPVIRNQSERSAHPAAGCCCTTLRQRRRCGSSWHHWRCMTRRWRLVLVSQPFTTSATGKLPAAAGCYCTTPRRRRRCASFWRRWRCMMRRWRRRPSSAARATASSPPSCPPRSPLLAARVRV